MRPGIFHTLPFICKVVVHPSWSPRPPAEFFWLIDGDFGVAAVPQTGASDKQVTSTIPVFTIILRSLQS